MGSGLHHRTFQGLVNVIHFGMTVDEAINAPDFSMPSFTPAGVKVAVPKGRFPTHVLDETGYDTIEFDTESARFGGEGHRHAGFAAPPPTYSRLWTLSRTASSTCRSMRGAA